MTEIFGTSPTLMNSDIFFCVCWKLYDTLYLDCSFLLDLFDFTL
jgi:hypothetical protein